MFGLKQKLSLATATIAAISSVDGVFGVQVFVKTLTGKSHTCEVEHNSTWADLKQQLAEKNAGPVELQHIVIGGEEKKDADVIDEDVLHGTVNTINLILQLPATATEVEVASETEAEVASETEAEAAPALRAEAAAATEAEAAAATSATVSYKIITGNYADMGTIDVDTTVNGQALKQMIASTSGVPLAELGELVVGEHGIGNEDRVNLTDDSKITVFRITETAAEEDSDAGLFGTPEHSNGESDEETDKPKKPTQKTPTAKKTSTKSPSTKSETKDAKTCCTGEGCTGSNTATSLIIGGVAAAIGVAVGLSLYSVKNGCCKSSDSSTEAAKSSAGFFAVGSNTAPLDPTNAEENAAASGSENTTADSDDKHASFSVKIASGIFALAVLFLVTFALAKWRNSKKQMWSGRQELLDEDDFMSDDDLLSDNETIDDLESRGTRMIRQPWE